MGGKLSVQRYLAYANKKDHQVKENKIKTKISKYRRGWKEETGKQQAHSKEDTSSFCYCLLSLMVGLT